MCLRIAFFVLSAVTALVPQTRAEEKTTAHAIIDRALTAGGGAEKISQFKALSFTAETTIGDEKVKVSGLFAGPDLFRMKVDTKRGSAILVAGGDTFWLRMGKEEFKEYGKGSEKNEFENVTRLFYGISRPDQLLALKGKGYTLTIVGDQAVNGVQAVAMRVNHELHPEVMIYFDKETGLPVKSQVQLLPRDDGGEGFFGKPAVGKPATERAEIFFDDYKEVNSVKHFTNLKVRLADANIELKLREIKLLKKVDSGQFKKPG